MYNHLLDTFIAVSDYGSFTKAAEHLYVSPTAVMKQMNTLEEHLGVQLVERTASGITLTKAGNIIYHDACFLVDYSKKSLASAKVAMQEHDHVFSVGTSLLNPAKPFMDLWYQANEDFSNFKLHLVPFEDNHQGIIYEIMQLGEKFDFLIGVCDSKTWMHHCNVLPLGTYRKMIAVSREHPLAKKEIVNIEDLYDEILMMVKKGDSETNDKIRADIKKNHPKIRIEDTSQFYDLSVFNRCAESNHVLLMTECWTDVHPGLVSIPVNWDYRIPYGLLYSLHPSDDVARFIEKARELEGSLA